MRVLATRFGQGLEFLAAWQAWREAGGHGLLHYAAVAAEAPAIPPTSPLAAQSWDLRPAFHRLSFDEGRVLLTLCIGELPRVLRELDFTADAIDAPGLDAALLPVLVRTNRCLSPHARGNAG